MTKKSKLFFLLLLLTFYCGNGQNQLAKKGTIILADNLKIAFNNLRLINGKFAFSDVASGTEKELAIKEIKYVEDDKMSRIFTNKTVETADDVKKANEDRQHAVEEKEKMEMNEKLRIMREEAGSLKLRRNGIYITKEDFIKERISSSDEVVAKGMYGFEKPVLTKIEDNCFFYYKATDEKIKDVFAICYKGHLYFQIRAILENRNKTDRAQTNEFPNSFTRVLSGGQNYYYLEASLANQWAQGFAYGGVGGATGGALANTMINGKGVVWDVKNQEFNIFKNCNDYNEFIKDKYPDGVQKCERQQPDILEVRKAIEKIK
ncbi:hypothetical protein [Flavobacterium sp. N1994]|uniref:hypothetical protein n=1 Tax=Flavobacterium sp. N1994 TaxID=2986827 RepID=UPI002221F2DF|nr:hypothetical protein [Flavobacterium sp. N1994]